ncbi:hypothetical protein MANES_02G225801v8 [Manihot esculenta]|uniref:Uncharacterized protein n=1 Tax=Manihot esculenta TaxID=3983 RepID=A0ACB7IBS7_MANES|nr:hypothetical protein MANES_02G225801v8 [Manihot esculenta]
MEEKLIDRLESAVARLEALSTSAFMDHGVSNFSGADVTIDPSIVAFDDLLGQFFGRVLAADEKIGGQVLEVTKVAQEAFSVQKELLIKAKQTQKLDFTGLAEFLKPFEICCGRSNSFSMDCLYRERFGMSMPIAHVEES